MSLTARTSKATAWSFGGYQAGAILSFAVSVVAARVLAPEELGRYALVALIVALVTSLSSLQMGGYYIVAESASPRLLRTGLTLELAIGFVTFTLLGVGGAGYGVLSGDTEFSWLLVVAGFVLLTNPFGSLAAHFTRELHYRPAALAQTGATVVGCAVKIGLLAAGAGVWGLVIGDAVVSLVFGATMLALVPSGRGLALDRELARQQVRFGLPSLATGCLSSASARAPEAAVAAFLGTRELGVYYIASRIPAQIFQLGKSLSLALLPAFSRASDEQLERGFGVALRLSAFFIGLPLAFLLVFAELFVSGIYGDGWSHAALPLVVLTAAFAIRFVLWHVGNLLKARRRVREMTWLTAGQLLLLVPTCFVGAKLGGLVGVASAVLAVELALVPIRVALAKSVVRVRLGQAIAEPMAVVAAVALLGFAVSAVFGPLLSVALGAFLTTSVFGSAVWRRHGDVLARALPLKAVRPGV